jgi:hypothetical protein
MNFSLKKLVSGTAIFLIMSTVPIYADTGFVFGFSYNFGSGAPKLGATAKVLSSDASDEVVAAAGVSYFFDDKSLGWDVGLGYTFVGGAVIASYDLTHKAPQLSVGFGEIREPERHRV